MVLSKKRITKALIRLRGRAGWSAPVLFANPRRQVFLRRGPFNYTSVVRNSQVPHQVVTNLRSVKSSNCMVLLKFRVSIFHIFVLFDC